MEKGIYAASVTPLHEDLSCNVELLTENCLDLIKRGCTGVALFGTTGEGPSFSTDEKRKALKQVIQLGLHPQKILLGNGSSSLQDTIELAIETIEQNCIGCLISPPCFFKNVTEDGVIDFYREVIKQVQHPKLKIILYHIPQYSGVPITVDIVQTLCTEFPGVIIGFKESEGNLFLTKAILETSPQCKVYVGREVQLPEALKFGASGGICGMANLFPELLSSLRSDSDTSKLQKISFIFKQHPFIASCKALLSLGNPDWNRVRPPLTSISQEELQQLQEQLQLALA